MLDAETKARIDSARQMLVGKVPDPKSQVEQITIAMIYKFMDDMDAEAVEFGGKRTFFAGEYAKFGWSKLMKTGLAGHEMLALYSDAIGSMTQNPGLPPLFRDIFKNAYLPYRDPETLRAFLKIINEFHYDHSERLGDAFEYLLSILGSQGDAGQFRTPRHIIDFMVEIMKPQKNEVVLDPACGTAGFLISAYKHILRNNTDKKGNSTLTPDQKAKLVANFKGYDISPDMVRLSLVNLYLHGFTDPHIYEYDTLTSEERWNEFSDVILANPPFMSPKGGIKPHKRFSIQAKRSEVLFVDYMAEHLTPNGRAAIIVPEGIIFQSQTAYKELRQMLVDNSLVAVISLPPGCFNPYSGVKTSILILDKSLAKSADSIAFFKVENDGFSLGAQRRAIEKNDLPQVQVELERYLNTVRKSEDLSALELVYGQLVPKTKIAVNGDYNLSGERYREGTIVTSFFPFVHLGELCEVSKGSPITRNEVIEGSIPVIAGGQKPSCYHNASNRTGETITVSASGAYAGFVAYFNEPIFASDCSTIKSIDQRLITKFLFYLLKSKQSDIYALQVGMGQPHVYSKDLANLQIPLPPLDVQKEIVAEIDGYQKVIHGARAVLDNYRPNINARPEWPIVEIGTICTIVRGSSPRPQGDPNFFGGPVPRLMVADITRDGMYTTPQIDSLTELGATKSRPMKKGDVIITVSGNPGLPTILAIDACIHDGFVGLRGLNDSVNPEYLYFALLALHASHGSQSVGAVFKNLTTDQIREFKIALPPLTTQLAIVAEIEAEQALVAANRELIDRMERKIEGVLARVWGE